RQLPSTMTRLAYIAGFRDPNSGAYSHPCASNEAEKVEIARLLETMHEEAFRIWLNYPLEEQKADLDLYFSGLDCGKATAVKTWLKLESYRSLIPASATSAERQLFIGDLHALLSVIAVSASTIASRTEADVPEGPLLTTREVSRWLGVSSRTLRLWAESCEIPALKVGCQWRFDRDSIREWLKRRNRDD
ncbi:MAG: helix-turn-helix domain-containing protein, partial [bacterium]